jgi:hypothetical protein
MSTKNQKRKNRLINKHKKNTDDLDQIIAEAKKLDSQPQNEQPANEQPTDAKENFIVPKKQVIEKANEMWRVFKNYVTNTPEYKELKDQDKLDLFRTKFGYAVFMEEFPIVARYMICYGQYSAKALSRMLYKIENAVHPPPDQRDKKYMEDQWVRRQADYVQYLWEAYQKSHYNTAEKQWIWQTTYERLKNEFDDFRNMHKEVEERVKVEKKELAGQNVRELLERVASGKQQLTAEEEELLLTELRNIVEHQNDPDEEEPAAPDSKEPKILMIETVDVERMNEIDDQYKPAELRGMEPVLEEDAALECDVVECDIVE